MGGKQTVPFGASLRRMRVAKGLTLRKFAETVGLSPTYVSQVEQGHDDPPTAERVAKMAEILGENPDELIALAGRLPGDLPRIIQNRPEVMPALLRAADGLTVAQIRQLTEQAWALQGEREQ